MTDLLDSTTDAIQQARIEQLRQRRAASGGAAPASGRSNTAGTSAAASSATSATSATPRQASRRGHPAKGGRIAAAGLGMAAMLGLVAVMGLARRSSADSNPPTVVSTPPAQVVVVIHQDGTPNASSAPPADPAQGQIVASAPTQLTAQPVVRAAPQANAPKATTNGSR